MQFKNLSGAEFEKLYYTHWKRLYRRGYAYLRDKTTAQELVQDVFVKVWTKRGELGHVKNMEAYLLQCLKNKLYDHYDKISCQERLKQHSLENYQEEIHPIEEGIAYEETLGMINSELEKLPVTTSTIFRMSKFGRYTNNEIAAEMQVSAKAVEYHITQALKKLRILFSHPAIHAAVMIFIQ